MGAAYDWRDGPAAPGHDDRLALVHAYGTDAIAYSTLQPRMRFFETSFGFIAYKRVGAGDIALGPPICAAADRREMLRRFLAQARRPMFCYVRANVLAMLLEQGLHPAGIGIDRWVDLPALLRAPARPLRSACRKAAKAAFSLVETDLSTLAPATRAQLDIITKRFLARSACAYEMHFINRPMTYLADDRRVFLLHKHDREHDGVFGYAVLNPMYDSGRVTGYMLDILRFERTRLWGVWLTTVWHLAQRLAEEGMAFSLGFCPFHRLPIPPGGRTLLQRQVETLARYLEDVPYVRRLHERKALIPGGHDDRYFATSSRIALRSFAALVQASEVPLSYLYGPNLIASLRSGLDKSFRQLTGRA